MTETESGNMQPRRGDAFEKWLRTQRDAAADHPVAYDAADGLLDLYRLHADTGTPLGEHVCSAQVVGDCECMETPVIPAADNDRSPLPEAMVQYLAHREVMRNQDIDDFIGKLTARESVLMREAAVMGYVQGVRHLGDTRSFKDSAVFRSVVDACLAFPDLYPAVDAARGHDLNSTVDYFLQTQDASGNWVRSSDIELSQSRIKKMLEERKIEAPEGRHRIAWRMDDITIGTMPGWREEDHEQ